MAKQVDLVDLLNVMTQVRILVKKNPFAWCEMDLVFLAKLLTCKPQVLQQVSVDVLIV